MPQGDRQAVSNAVIEEWRVVAGRGEFRERKGRESKQRESSFRDAMPAHVSEAS